MLKNKAFSAITAYPDIAKDYASTLNAMKLVKFDLWVASHGGQFNLLEKHDQGVRIIQLHLWTKKTIMSKSTSSNPNITKSWAASSLQVTRRHNCQHHQWGGVIITTIVGGTNC